jgi:hypothetical protein
MQIVDAIFVGLKWYHKYVFRQLDVYVKCRCLQSKPLINGNFTNKLTFWKMANNRDDQMIRLCL